MKKLLIAALTFCVFSAQANIIYDKSGVNEKDFVYDEYQCQELSQQVHKDNESRNGQCTVLIYSQLRSLN